MSANIVDHKMKIYFLPLRLVLNYYFGELSFFRSFYTRIYVLNFDFFFPLKFWQYIYGHIFVFPFVSHDSAQIFFFCWISNYILDDCAIVVNSCVSWEAKYSKRTYIDCTNGQTDLKKFNSLFIIFMRLVLLLLFFSLSISEQYPMHSANFFLLLSIHRLSRWMEKRPPRSIIYCCESLCHCSCVVQVMASIGEKSKIAREKKKRTIIILEW